MNDHQRVRRDNNKRRRLTVVDQSSLDSSITVTFVAIYRGYTITPDEIASVAAQKSLEPLRSKYFIKPYEPAKQVERDWGSRMSAKEREALRYSLDKDLQKYRDNDDRMDLDRYEN